MIRSHDSQGKLTSLTTPNMLRTDKKVACQKVRKTETRISQTESHVMIETAYRQPSQRIVLAKVFEVLDTSIQACTAGSSNTWQL